LSRKADRLEATFEALTEAEVDRVTATYAPLTEAVRQLIDATVRTQADDDLIARARTGVFAQSADSACGGQLPGRRSSAAVE